MAGFPRTFYRETKHRPARRQLYQPGFNALNSCWLPGQWVVVSDERWAARHEHQRLYEPILSAKIHHRDPGTKPEDMTPAQRQGWEFYSGQQDFYYRDAQGQVGIVALEMAGEHVSPSSLAYAQRSGFKFLRRIQDPNGPERDQLEGHEIPESLVSEVDSDKVISPWHEIVEQNRQHGRDMTAALLPVALSGDPLISGVVIHSLLELEEETVRAEWNQQTGRTDVFARDPAALQAEYVATRRHLTEQMSNFDDVYARNKESHNKCARINLDNSKGALFCFVLPVFHADGTHEPWGPKDVPWSAATD